MGHRFFALIAIITTASCVADELEPSDDFEERAAAAAVPVCDPDQQLDTVDCELDLSGVEGPSCEAQIAGIEDDGTFWVTAAAEGSCQCEWTPPGGENTVGCGDLDPNYETPDGSEAVCQAVVLQGGRAGIERTGHGATYEEAELAALVACELGVQNRCIESCAYNKNRGYHDPDQTIPCCVPRVEECADGLCDGSTGGDPEPTPLPG